MSKGGIIENDDVSVGGIIGGRLKGCMRREGVLLGKYPSFSD